MKHIHALIAGLALLAGASAANAADLSTGGLKDGPVVNNSWTGFYTGINAGYGWNPTLDFSSAWTDSVNANKSYKLSTGLAPQGWFGGGQVGYNFQPSHGSVVLGLESDIQGANISGSSTVSGTQTTNLTSTVASQSATFGNSSSRVDWFGTTRARAGFLLGSSVLTYGTAGLAYGGVSQGASVSGIWDLSNASTRWGWTAGAGVEAKLTDRWSVKGEYLHIDLMSDNLSGLVAGAAVSTNKQDNAFDVIRAGVNYKW